MASRAGRDFFSVGTRICVLCFFGEEQKKYAAVVWFSNLCGSDTRVYSTNYSSSRENAFRLEVTPRAGTKLIVLPPPSRDEAKLRTLTAHLPPDNNRLITWNRPTTTATIWHKPSTSELPDEQLQQAYDWSRVSMLQGVVTNPDLGMVFIAGYRTSGDGQRPGFAWYFGRDSMWTSLALTASGDFATARSALEFLSKIPARRRQGPARNSAGSKPGSVVLQVIPTHTHRPTPRLCSSLPPTIM